MFTHISEHINKPLPYFIERCVPVVHEIKKINKQCNFKQGKKEKDQDIEDERDLLENIIPLHGL